MSVDIDYFTLHRLTEKAFRFEESDKKILANKIGVIIENNASADAVINAIVALVEEDILSRKIIFASSTADPTAALKPKGRAFRRVTDEDTESQVQTPPVALTEDEIARRMDAAKAAQAKNKAFYKMIDLHGGMDEEDEDEEDEGEAENSGDTEESNIEELLKAQIMASKQLEAAETAETKEEFEDITGEKE
jgi:hypothetical protein